MKYLGIDYGEKRVGIAVSDIEEKLAFPKIVLENTTELINKISDLCKEFDIGVIVIGESKDYKGEDNKISPKIISFKHDLSLAIKLPIYLEPEFMSSMQVEKTFGKTKMLDASAAAIILQTFMDKQKSKMEGVKSKNLIKNPKIYLEDEPLKNIVQTSELNSKINYDDFKRVEMKVGKILEVVAVAGSIKLYKLSIDFAEGKPRQIVSGIAQYFPDSQKLLGKKVAFVTNLEPRPLMGLISDGMILAAKSGDELALLEVPDFIEEGTILG